MKYSPPSIVATIALLLTTTSTLTWAQAAADAPAPTISFTELRADSLKRISGPGEVPAFEVQNNTQTSILLKFPLTAFDPASVDETTQVGITVGNFSHDATLGDSVNWKPGKQSATFDMLIDTGNVDANGDPIQKRVGSITYVWSDKKLSVFMAGHDFGSIIADSAEELLLDVEGWKAKFLEHIDSSVTFGDQTGSGALYAKGVAKHLTKRKGSDIFDLYKLNAVSYYDRMAPNVKVGDPVDGSSTDQDFVTISGSASDNVDATSALVLSKVLVNGLDVTDSVSPTFEDGDDSSIPVTPGSFSVDGIELTKRTNTIQLFVADTSGNTSMVTSHITNLNIAIDDNTSPVAAITDPSENATVDTNILTITGTATDNLNPTSELTLVQASLNGVDVTADMSAAFNDADPSSDPATPAGFSISGFMLSEGANNIVIVISDRAGNKTTLTRNVTYVAPAS